MTKIYSFICLLLIPFGMLAQKATIKGTITNAKTKESLPGVNITVSPTQGVTSDANGNFQIQVDPGKIKLTYTFIGFSTISKTYELRAGDVFSDNISMTEESLVIEGVVVSAGKFEQRISDVSVSMSVLKPEMLESQNTNDVTEALKKIPGLDINDGQPSIRGGSGYSYGAGSRVLLLVDDLPILTPDAGDAKWNFIPIENISQIEVLKGASSALFGSSALNGVINVRTAFPKEKPVTKFSINTGIFMNPKREEMIWWGSSRPGFSGLNFLHSQKFGQVDLTVGANGYLFHSYRESEGETHGRVNVNFRYRDKKIEGLSYGVNGNFMYQDKTDFFLWQNADTGAWRQNLDAVNKNQGYRLNIDPYIVYFNKKGARHSLRTRYFNATNIFKGDSSKNNNSDMVYGEYQFHHKIKNKIDLTTGILGSYATSEALLFGEHFSINSSVYLQLDFQVLKKLNISLGGRAEYYRIDTSETSSNYAMIFTKDTISLPIWPVFRAGVNYHLFKYTFLRMSYGQGYRFPTIAEKYIKTSLGSLNIFPNPDLKPETGWNAELGVKQGMKFGGWNGYLDVAGFWTEYSNMMEFTFGLYTQDTAVGPTLSDLGFKSINVGRARITGIDLTFTGQGRILTIPTTVLVGYTYTNPVDLVTDSAYLANKSTADNILKYRYYSTIKGDIEFDLGMFLFGVTYVYTSNMINIDKKFEGYLVEGWTTTAILPGLKDYRAEHNKGSHVLDIRVGFTPNEYSKFNLIMKNVLNYEYMSRPGLIEAPRNIALQYSVSF